MNAIAIPKNTRIRRYAPLACAVLVALACSSISPVGKAEQSPKQAAQLQHHWYQIGRASWYGELFQGRLTASGENFDMNAMTCAHPTLPLGSLVRVTNLRNHRSVVVRVNDRGPVAPNRIIDLSYAAARFLGFGRRGTAPVRLDLLPPNSQLAQMTFPASRND